MSSFNQMINHIKEAAYKSETNPFALYDNVRGWEQASTAIERILQELENRIKQVLPSPHSGDVDELMGIFHSPELDYFTEEEVELDIEERERRIILTAMKEAHEELDQYVKYGAGDTQSRDKIGDYLLNLLSSAPVPEEQL